MNRSDELDRYRREVAAAMPENPRRERDIHASLRAFDAARGARGGRWVRDWGSGWRRACLLALAAGVMAVAYLPLTPKPPATAPAPELRLALPAEPLGALRDGQVLAAFQTDLPHYFPLPWARGDVLAVLAGTQGEPAETVLFAAEGRRLAILPRTPDIAGARGEEESYQRFATALAGLALLAKGAVLGPEWSAPALLAQARRAAKGLPLREAALLAVTDR